MGSPLVTPALIVLLPATMLTVGTSLTAAGFTALLPPPLVLTAAVVVVANVVVVPALAVLLVRLLQLDGAIAYGLMLAVPYEGAPVGGEDHSEPPPITGQSRRQSRRPLPMARWTRQSRSGRSPPFCACPRSARFSRVLRRPLRSGGSAGGRLRCEFGGWFGGIEAFVVLCVAVLRRTGSVRGNDDFTDAGSCNTWDISR